MFGAMSPRLKGGLTRLQQMAAYAGSMLQCWLVGPAESDLGIKAGTSPSGTGRNLSIAGGDPIIGTGGGGAGGALNLSGGAAYSSASGAVAISTPNAGGSGSQAGTITIAVGKSAGSGLGAAVTITAGEGGDNGGLAGGALNLRGGKGGLNGPGANVNIQGGVGGTGTPGSIGGIELDGGQGSQLSTSSTRGHTRTTSCAGTPTGTPATTGGMAAFLPDTTNNRWWVYATGGWKRANLGGAINSQSADYTCTLSDGGPERAVLHPSTDANARTFTIPANASVAYDLGTELEFINDSVNAVSIAINTDTLAWEGTGATGTRTLAQYGRARAKKIAATRWYITGTNLT